MAIPILTISNREEDIRLGSAIAKANDLPFINAISRSQVKEILVDYPQALVFWDTDHSRAMDDANPLSLVGLNQVLLEQSKPFKVFAVTDKPLNQNPALSEMSSFGHHIFRRYEDPATAILSKLLGASLISYPFGILRYMPENTKAKKITLRESGQKRVAVQAVQNVLEKNGIPERLSAQVAQATDELLLNAIFDAPVREDGQPLRKEADRSENFEMTPEEYIELSIASSEKYLCICVADQFGTLKKEVVLSFIRENFKNSPYQLEGARKRGGLGLNGVIQSGLSLLFISRPGVRTEVSLFFPRVANYREFRKGFRFLSLLSP